MARKSSGGSRGFGGRGSRAGGFKSSRSFGSSSRSLGSSSRSFKTGSSRHVGGYNYRSRPYRRNRFFNKLGPVGKLIYVVLLLAIYLFLMFL